MTQTSEKLPPAPVLAARPQDSAPASFVALMYHNISADAGRYPDLSSAVTSYFITRSVFAAQLDQIAALSPGCMNMRALHKFYAQPAETPAADPRPAILLTFDDGWRDVITVGGDLLRERNLQAIVFVTTDFLGRPHCLSRSELAAIDAKTFHIGSHAVSHKMLSPMPESVIRTELAESKKMLEDLLSREVDSISIPNGAVDARVRRIAAECGYRFLFDSEVHLNRRGGDPFQIGRISIRENTSLEIFRSYLRGQFSRERFRRAVLSAPKRLLGLNRYDRLRRRVMGEKSPTTSSDS